MLGHEWLRGDGGGGGDVENDRAKLKEVIGVTCGQET
jgi:hypothetical protein